MKGLIITVVGILLGVIASLANVVWLIVLAAVVALAGAYLQYRDTLAFEYAFTSGQWQGTGTDLKLVIPKAKHKKSAPTATVLQCTPQGYEEVICDVTTDSASAVVLGAAKAFEGKVVVK